MANGIVTPSMRAMTTNNSSHIQQQDNSGSCCETTHDEVARAAFGLYEKHGSQDGHDVRNWLDAEAHMKSKHVRDLHGHQATEKQARQSAR